MPIRTLNQIIGEFQEIANQHRQINNFTVGTLEDFATSGTTNYPAWWVGYDSNAFASRTEDFTFKFWLVDRVKKDRSNLIEIHSDLKQVAMDIISQLNDSGYGWRVSESVNLSAIYEPFHEDEVAGWSFDFTISQPFTKDVCQIPFIEPIAIGRSQSGYNPNTPLTYYVPVTRTITIDGVTYDLSSNRTWTTSGTTGGNYVPYTGATGNVDLGTNGLTTDYLSFSLNPTGAIGSGKIIYDGASGALSYNLNNSNVPSRIGQTIHAYVHNAEAVQINKGEAVYLYQASGNKASVKLAYNTSDATSAKTFGLAAENIGAGQNGMVICQGVIDGLNTGSYNEGDTLYLGATAGTLTASKPYAPNHLVYIGVVEKANNGNGQIYVKVQNGYELDELHNVNALNPTNNDIIVYSSGTNLWEKTNILTAIGAASTSSNGYLTSTDWNTFNNKASQDSFTIMSIPGAVSPADNTTYYFGLFAPVTPTTVEASNNFNIGYSFTIIGAVVQVYGNTIQGSSETGSFQLRNTTQSTSTTIIAALASNATSSTRLTTTVTGLNISVAAGDSIALQFNAPSFSTNPTNVTYRTFLICTR